MKFSFKEWYKDVSSMCFMCMIICAIWTIIDTIEFGSPQFSVSDSVISIILTLVLHYFVVKPKLLK